MDVVSFLRNYDYEVSLAKGNMWTLEEAVDYLAAYRANNQAWNGREDAYAGFVGIREQLLTAVQHAIDEGWLNIHEVYKESSDEEAGINSEIDFRKSSIVPLLFINWAINSNIEVPQQYKAYADRYKDDNSAYYEGAGIKKVTIHHERCRAVAELLWLSEPDMPIAVMARRPEIIEFGCEGHRYDMRTISRWLASLKADRKPGRRRNKEVLENPS